MRIARPHIFLAHSTKTAEDKAVLEAVQHAVAAVGLECLVDNGFIRPAQQISDEVITNLMSASGGIVLVSKAAAEDSEWVPHEAFLMGVRRIIHGDAYPLLVLEAEEGLNEILFERHPQLRTIVGLQGRLAATYEPNALAGVVETTFSSLASPSSWADPLFFLKRKVWQWVTASIREFSNQFAICPLPDEAEQLFNYREEWRSRPCAEQRAAFTEWLFCGEVNPFLVAKVLKAVGCSNEEAGKRIVKTATLSVIPLEDVEPIRSAINAGLKHVYYTSTDSGFVTQLVRRALPEAEGDGWYLWKNVGPGAVADAPRRQAPGDRWEVAADHWSGYDLETLQKNNHPVFSQILAPANEDEAAMMRKAHKKVPSVIFVLYGAGQEDAHICSFKEEAQLEYMKCLKLGIQHFEAKDCSL